MVASIDDLVDNYSLPGNSYHGGKRKTRDQMAADNELAISSPHANCTPQHQLDKLNVGKKHNCVVCSCSNKHVSPVLFGLWSQASL